MQPTANHLGAYLASVRDATPLRWQGAIVQANAQSLESMGPPCAIGECCEIRTGSGDLHPAEVIGFRSNRVLLMPLQSTEGFRHGDTVYATGRRPSIAISDAICGRVLDALGRPLDGLGPLVTSRRCALDVPGPDAMERKPIRETMNTGVRAIDAMLTIGRGQRVGLFGGSGVGKSTLIGNLTRHARADVVIVGLVGERGREVREFLDDSLGEEGRKRAAVFVSTSDQSPLLRMRAAQAATTAAEYFAAQGKHVLLVLDSLTRYAMAAREIGLAAGEPPASKGYTPSVFSHLARLVERTGNFERGSITALYTVLMEGDDQQDPIVDSVRSLLDGHIVLSRALAMQSWFPPISILDSISRLMPAVTTAEHRAHANEVRALMAAYAHSEDLLRMGAYVAGSDAMLDRAVMLRSALRTLLTQGSDEVTTFDDTVRRLTELVA